MGKEKQPWDQKHATRQINSMAEKDDLTVAYRLHARERLRERGLIQSDVLYVLRQGFVQQAAEPATRDGYFKYVIQTLTPNSPNREVGCCVIPDPQSCTIKIVTVMFVDENQTRSGSIVGEENERVPLHRKRPR